MDLYKKYEEQIKAYCLENGLDFEKLKRTGLSWGEGDLWFHYYDPSVKTNGLLDETPAPIVLIMEVSDQEVVFEQTEYTEKYLR